MLGCITLEAIADDAVAHAMLFSARMDAVKTGLGSVVVGSIADWQRWGVWSVDDNDQPIRPMHGHKDYSRANRMGSRGVYVHYTLPAGRYMVKAPFSWRGTDIYICRITDAGEVMRERSI